MAVYRLTTSIGTTELFAADVTVGKKNQIVFDRDKKLDLLEDGDYAELQAKLYKREQQFGNYSPINIYKVKYLRPSIW